MIVRSADSLSAVSQVEPEKTARGPASDRGLQPASARIGTKTQVYFCSCWLAGAEAA
jgi:hypothetical protein